ncbi:hypothetical protein BDV98DRAFT_586800 [Pterulicium gracile]|uniref:Uncharacterized protein n=1 Tax=Pterulicium gracile TaxID=1884261 RepID=A0A5C3Q3U7_9AGAR|nr:hypothetical protein BDV98DRAFT_586800 [Pterula gracilis]
MTLNSGSKAVCPSRNYGRASTKEILTEVKGNLEAQYESASLLQEPHSWYQLEDAASMIRDAWANNRSNASRERSNSPGTTQFGREAQSPSWPEENKNVTYSQYIEHLHLRIPAVRWQAWKAFYGEHAARTGLLVWMRLTKWIQLQYRGEA